MTRNYENKLNQLLKNAPHGMPLTTGWLIEHGISTKLAWWYVKAGWLSRIADGIYLLTGDHASWQGAVAALQQQSKLKIYPGGKTALQIMGKGHYITHELRTIQLFAQPNTKAPSWIKSDYWEQSLQLHSPKLFKKIDDSWLQGLQVSGQELIISSPEKAILELCSLIPKYVTFAEAALIIEGLPRIRSKLLQPLLENCQSYKVKRLVLYFGDHFNHAWMRDIDMNSVDLGKGKRVISGGGHYSAKFQISVPKIGGNHDKETDSELL